MGFISQDFRSSMLEIWIVKYLQMPRFRELISSIALEIRLEHFRHDGDSPDIPIPVYVDYLKRIRELARSKRNERIGCRDWGLARCTNPGALYENDRASLTAR